MTAPARQVDVGEVEPHVVDAGRFVQLRAADDVRGLMVEFLGTLR